MQCDNDNKEWESYIANLEVENIQNELYHVVKNAGLSDSGLLSGCLYSDVDNTQEYHTMKLVSVISNHNRKFINIDTNNPIFTYKNTGGVWLLNN